MPRKLCKRQGISFDAVEAAIFEIVGAERASYRDIHNAISKVKLMKSAGLDMPVQAKVRKEELLYFG